TGSIGVRVVGRWGAARLGGAEVIRNLDRSPFHGGGQRRNLIFAHSCSRTGDAKGGDRLLTRIQNRRSYASRSGHSLFVIHGVALAAHLFKFGFERGPAGNRVKR